MKSFKIYHIDSEYQGLTVELYMKNVLHYSGRGIQRLTRQKGIEVNKKTVYLQKKIKAGDVLRVLELMDTSYGVLPELGPIDILFEDAQVIILNKPPKMLVHPSGQTKNRTLANYLAYYFQQCGKIVTVRPLHRLDRDTSGCVAFAKDSDTQSNLEQQLGSGVFKRTYHGIVEGNIEPPMGTIDAPIGPHPKMQNRRAINDQGEKAITHYRTLQKYAGISLLELTLETGRTHQIRIHLAHLGHPIIGDRMYGKSSLLIARQALHAESVIFSHPKSGQIIHVQAPIPPDMERVVTLLNSI